MTRLDAWRTRRWHVGRGGTGLLLGLLLAGCLGRVSYGPGLEPAAGAAAAASVHNLPRPLRLMVMPLTVQAAVANGGAVASAAEPEREAQFRREFNAALDALPRRFARVPLPAGPEADAVIREAMASPTGQPAPAAFAKVKGFAAADYLLYGTATLGPPPAAATTPFTAELSLRLVDSQSLAYLPLVVRGQGATAAAALRDALERGVRLLAGR